MHLAENLKKLRKYKKLSIKELALKLDVCPSTISSWEKGKTKPNLKYVIKIVKYFGITIEDLIKKSE